MGKKAAACKSTSQVLRREEGVALQYDSCIPCGFWPKSVKRDSLHPLLKPKGVEKTHYCPVHAEDREI